jgi:UDP-glucose 4-epimerase
MNRKIIVTGGCGYIGSHVARAFKQAGDQVFIIDRVQREHTLKGIDGYYIGDFADYASLSTIYDMAPDIIVHCAGTSLVGPSMTDPGEYYDNNIAKTIRMLNAVKDFDKASSIDKNNLNACLYAAEATTAIANQGGSSQKKFLETAIGYYKKADRLNPNNPIIMSNLGFLYYRIKDCDKAVFYLDQTKDFEGLSPQERQQAHECLKTCGH